MSGAAKSAQKLKCARDSAGVSPPFPISSMSGSFQWPGPAYGYRSAIRSMMWTTPIPPQLLPQSQQSWMSPVARQSLPTPCAQSHGLVEPHSQMLKTIGRPLAASARRIGRRPRGRPAPRVAPVVLQVVDAPLGVGPRVDLLVVLAAGPASARARAGVRVEPELQPLGMHVVGQRLHAVAEIAAGRRRCVPASSRLTCQQSSITTYW